MKSQSWFWVNLDLVVPPRLVFLAFDFFCLKCGLSQTNTDLILNKVKLVMAVSFPDEPNLLKVNLTVLTQAHFKSFIFYSFIALKDGSNGVSKVHLNAIYFTLHLSTAKLKLISVELLHGITKIFVSVSWMNEVIQTLFYSTLAPLSYEWPLNYCLLKSNIRVLLDMNYEVNKQYVIGKNMWF